VTDMLGAGLGGDLDGGGGGDRPLAEARDALCDDVTVREGPNTKNASSRAGPSACGGRSRGRVSGERWRCQRRRGHAHDATAGHTRSGDSR
jgi:hypothetical protein